MKMKLTIPALLAFSLPLGSQTTEPEDWARAIVDSPYFVDDDQDARAASLLELIERDPAHPLVEIALRMIAWGVPDDPRPVSERVLALDPARLSPAAASLLVDLQSKQRAKLAPGEPVPKWEHDHLYPGCFTHGLALGPLSDPFEREARTQLFSSPGFDREHDGLFGRTLRWQPLDRPIAVSSFDLDGALSSSSGWALSAFFFDLRGGGPGWIELDFGDAAGPGWVSILSAHDDGFRGTLGDPSCEFSLNGAATVVIDFLAEERSAVQREPAVFRDGRNRLLVASSLGARVRFSVRVLGANGRAQAELVEATEDGPLGRVVAGQPPPTPFPTAETWLESLARRGPDTEALLGMARIFDGRFAAGLLNLQNAVRAAPDRSGPRMLLAEAYNRSSYLPEAWASSRARERIEELVAESPEHVRMQIALAHILAPEDREEEAIAGLNALAQRWPTGTAASLALAWVYPRLDLEVPAERALLEAAARAPASPHVHGQLAAHWEEVGLRARGLENQMQALAAGADASELGNLAARQAELGRVAEAEASHGAAVALRTGEEELSSLADYYERIQRHADADRIFAELESLRPHESSWSLRRADVAHRRGDRDGELAHLRRALHREPSSQTARKRILALTGTEETEEFFERWAIDVPSELQGFDPAKWSDHVVRAIVGAVVKVFEDGAIEQWTHARDVARDLEGCESLGRQGPNDEMMQVATIKAADGKQYEAVLVDGEYVMPSLEPGDAVEVVSRSFTPAPADGIVRTGQWLFASIEGPFHLSRYVISIPKTLDLRMVLRNFTGEHTTREEGGNVMHLFVLREVDRVVPEPLSPPPDWYLPWVQFGMDRKRECIAEELAREVVLPTRVTPEIAESAAKATAGATSAAQRAALLHAFVGGALDKRDDDVRSSATAALLTRAGSGTFLYSALLAAADIEHEIFWSRGIAPEAEFEPDPAFLDAERWMNRFYVLVRPGDAEETWCDMSHKTLPYGMLVTDAPRASAFGTKSKRWIEMPDVPLAERAPGQSHTISIVLGSERAAEVEVDVQLLGNVGHVVKEQLRDEPKAQLKRTVSRIATQVIPGLDVADYELRGLESEREPLSFWAKGKHKAFLDETRGELACKLPIPPLQLSTAVAGEGDRKQSFFLPTVIVQRTRVSIEMPEGMTLVQPLQEVREECHGASYRLVLEPDGARAFTIVREFVSPPLLLQPSEFAAFAAFAKRVDEAERARLRFTRAR